MERNNKKSKKWPVGKAWPTVPRKEDGQDGALAPLRSYNWRISIIDIFGSSNICFCNFCFSFIMPPPLS